MKTSIDSIRAGDKVIRDCATIDQDKVHIGDWAPVFVRPGDKVARDTATRDESKVRLGDWAPTFDR
jgi:hypothetical protein